jgi:sec-independent protein translocase protein TatB
MFSNIGGLEVLFVMVVALIVLGPTKLPEAARQVGKFVNEVRRISSGFQKEFREAVQDPIIEAEARARGSIESTKMAVSKPFEAVKAPIEETLKAPVVDPTPPTAANNGDAPPSDGDSPDD